MNRRYFYQSASVHDTNDMGKLSHQPHVVPNKDNACADFFLRMDERLHDLLLYDHV